MADITLGDGRKIDFDLSKITVAEHEKLLSGKINQTEEYEILCKPSGFTLDELKALSLRDYKRMATAYIVKSISPIDDINDPKN